jgi:predicted nucleic acid-binding protein
VLYFDTSFLVPLFLPEPTSEKVERFLRRKRTAPLAISHWTRVEFASTLAREVRMGSLTHKAAIAADARFAEIAADTFILLAPNAADFDLANRFLLRRKIGLRAGDALHLAIAANNGASAIYSLDRRLLAAGRRLGLKARVGVRVGAGAP